MDTQDIPGITISFNVSINGDNIWNIAIDKTM